MIIPVRIRRRTAAGTLAAWALGAVCAAGDVRHLAVSFSVGPALTTGASLAVITGTLYRRRHPGGWLVLVAGQGCWTVWVVLCGGPTQMLFQAAFLGYSFLEAWHEDPRRTGATVTLTAAEARAVHAAAAGAPGAAADALAAARRKLALVA